MASSKETALLRSTIPGSRSRQWASRSRSDPIVAAARSSSGNLCSGGHMTMNSAIPVSRKESTIRSKASGVAHGSSGAQRTRERRSWAGSRPSCAQRSSSSRLWRRVVSMTSCSRVASARTCSSSRLVRRRRGAQSETGLPTVIGGRGRCTGAGASVTSLRAVVLALEAEGRLPASQHAVDDLHVLGKPRRSLGGRPVRGTRLVVVELLDALSDRELEPAV